MAIVLVSALLSVLGTFALAGENCTQTEGCATDACDGAECGSEAAGSVPVDDASMGEPTPADPAEAHAVLEETRRGSADWLCPRAAGASAEDARLQSLLSSNPTLASVTQNAEAHRLQVLVGEVVDDAESGRCLRLYGYRLQAEYIYPASAMKTIGAFAALRLMEETPGWAPDSLIRIHDHQIELSDASDTPGEMEVVSTELTTTLEQLLRSTLIVSSNRGFNSLFDIAGRDALNQLMWDAGLSTVRVWHRLSTGTQDPEINGHAPAISVRLGDDWQQVLDERVAAVELPPQAAPLTMLGTGYYDDTLGEVVPEPMDFGTKNGVSLLDLTTLVAAVATPDLVGVDRLGLDDETTLPLLMEIMSARPEGDTEEERLALEARYKPLSPGVLAAYGGDRSRFEYTNKAGRAYGFHLDSAYISDTATHRGFFVAASLWVNENEILNDNRYEYDSISYPFFVELGRVLTEAFLLEPAAALVPTTAP